MGCIPLPAAAGQEGDRHCCGYLGNPIPCTGSPFPHVDMCMDTLHYSDIPHSTLPTRTSCALPPAFMLRVLFPTTQQAPDWQEILQYFRGSELQNYFTRVLEDDLKAVIKPQYVVSGR